MLTSVRKAQVCVLMVTVRTLQAVSSVHVSLASCLMRRAPAARVITRHANKLTYVNTHTHTHTNELSQGSWITFTKSKVYCLKHWRGSNMSCIINIHAFCRCFYPMTCPLCPCWLYPISVWVQDPGTLEVWGYFSSQVTGAPLLHSAFILIQTDQHPYEVCFRS